MSIQNTVTLAEAANLILATPSVRYLLEGEPGIGKSSIMSILERELPGYHSAYIDMASLDLGDTGLPVPVHTDKLTAYYPNGRFKLHLNEPVILMLDEFGKASSRAVQNMLHPLLEARNPRFGDIPLHPDSIIFLSSNLASDGVQDDIRSHTRNRVTSVHVTKPDAEQWLNWAARNSIDPTVMAWVDRNPHALASYLDSGQSSNPFIFNPKTMHAKGAFVSPRSLQRASELIASRNRISSRGALRAALAGTVGQAAAADMEVFVNYQDKLPAFADIIDNPKGTPVPDNPGLCSILIYGAVQRVDTSDVLNKFMGYLDRMPTEWQPVFVKMFMSIPERVALTTKAPAFRDWCIANADIVG